MKNISRSVAFVLSVLLVSTIAGYVVLAWTEPGSPAPGGNVAAPINTGSNMQTKTGGLNVTGNVGIGTTNPAYRLDAAGYVNTNTGFCINGDCVASWANVSGPWTVSGNNIYNNKTGNVGIGTTNPSQKLDVAGSIRFGTGGGYLFSSASDNFILQTVTNTPNPNLTIGYGNGSGAGTIDTTKENFSMNAGKFMFNKGLVEIGSPNGGGSFAIPNTCSGNWLTNVSSGIFSPDPVFGCGDEWYIASYPRSGEARTLEIAIKNDGDDHIALMPSGNVGVGTITPATKLQVGNGGDGWANGLTIQSNYPTIYFRDSDNRSSMIHINSNLMYFLRGCDNASDPASGNSWCAYNGRWPLYINMDNNDAVFGGNLYGMAYYYNSDINLKKDIAPITGSLEKINDLNGVYFKWKADNAPSIGLIAQDVEKIFPEAVSTDKNSGLKSVDYGKIVAPLIEAVKEQQREISELKSQISGLESKINAFAK